MFVPVCPKCGEHRTAKITQTAAATIYKCGACGCEFAANLLKEEAFVVITEPGRVGTNAPSKTYSSYDQAVIVASKMAKEHRDTFYVAKLVARAELVEVRVEVLP